MSHLYVLPKINGKVNIDEGRFELPKAFSMPPLFPEENALFMQRLSRIGDYSLSCEQPQWIDLKTDDTIPEAGYRLHVMPDRAAITVRDAQGYAYALVTLYQLLTLGQGSAPACRMEDAPRFAWRGTMLDVCRHFYPAEEVKKILEQCALLKMNVFHWHLSDDQGFRIESRRFPMLNDIGSWRKLSPQDPVVEAGLAEPLARYGGYYTQEEIRDVVAYAAARHIDVVPEIDLPGHSSAILASCPQYTCSGAPLSVKNTYGVHERIFCAGRDETYTFLEELLDEVMELFPSAYIHLGGDEAPKTVWHDCPLCNERIRREGLKNYEELQAWFTGRLIAHVKKKGKTPIVWNESAASGMLDESAVVQYWTEMAPGESYMLPELRKGRKLILSDGDRLYISSGYAEMPMKSTLMYEPNVKGTPVPENCVQGIEAPMWTEWTAAQEDLEKLIWPRLMAVAELGWTRDREAEDFLSRCKCWADCAPLNLLAATPWNQATVRGDEAVAQVVRSLLTMGSRYRGMTTGEEGEQAGRAEAITPDGSAQVDPMTMIRIFVTAKMQAAYSQEEIEKAIGMVSQILAGRIGG